MKIITDIRSIGSGKYVLIIDKKKYTVYEDVLIDENILKEKQITEETFNIIQDKSIYYDAYYKIIKYITFKLRTKKEIMIKLESFKLNSKDVDDILERLKNEGYLNDKLYIKSYINDRINLSLNGPIKIKKTLYKLDLDKNLIEEYLNNIDNGVWINRINKIIDKKIKTSKDLSLKMFKLKLKSDLISLGYSEDLFKNIIDDVYYDDSNIYKNVYEKEYKKLFKRYNGQELEYKIKQKMYTLGFEDK